MLWHAIGLLRRRLGEPAVRDRVLRVLSIAALLVAVGACVVLLLAFVLRLAVLLVAFSGVFAMSVAFYLFVRLWPTEEPPAKRRPSPSARAAPARLSPEEYRKQREKAQRMIREKAAPALAKAIRGLLRQDEMARRKKR